MYVLLADDDDGLRVLGFDNERAAWVTWTRIPRVAEFLRETYEGDDAATWSVELLEAACREYNDAAEYAYLVDEMAVESAPYEDGALV